MTETPQEAPLASTQVNDALDARSALQAHDRVFCTYRGHGWALAARALSRVG